MPLGMKAMCGSVMAQVIRSGLILFILRVLSRLDTITAIPPVRPFFGRSSCPYNLSCQQYAFIQRPNNDLPQGSKGKAQETSQSVTFTPHQPSISLQHYSAYFIRISSLPRTPLTRFGYIVSLAIRANQPVAQTWSSNRDDSR